MKKISVKFTKILLLIAMIFSNFMTPISVLAEQSDESEEPIERGAIRLDGIISDTGSVTVTSGALTNGGDVQVTKTVSQTDTLGKYQVEFEIKGIDKQLTITEEKPLYLVIVFDVSNSMICGEGFVDIAESDEHYIMADGTKIKCDKHYNDGDVYDSSILTKDKWESAVSGAVEFSKEFAKIDNAYISLVNFGGTASDATPFVTKTALIESQFKYINVNGTNIRAGINEAQEKLETIDDPNAQKYILVIGDGKATAGEYCTGGIFSSTCYDDEEAAQNAANYAKSKGTKIFSVGYGLGTDEDSIEAREILKYISSNTQTDLSYYIEASVDKVDGELNGDVNGITSKLKTVFTKLGDLVKAGTKATLTDTVGEYFSIVDQEGNTYTSAEIAEITENGNKLSFYIQIDPTTPTGWYDTNNGFILEYTDFNGNTEAVVEYSSDDPQPQVYWEANNYKINYYKDSKTTTNKIASEEGYAPNNTVIDTDDFEELKHLPEVGYELLPENITPSSITVTNDGTVKEIDVVYTKINYNYVVNYYYDDVQDTTLTKNLTAPYNTQIDSKTYYQYNTRQGYVIDEEKSDNEVFTITEDGIVIDVYFKKAEYKYDVNYYFDGLEEKSLYKNPAALYGDTIFATNHYLTNGQLNIVNKGNYFIDPKKSDLAGGVYDETTNTITWTITETVTNFTDSKPITIEINYSIVYEDFADISASQNNKLINGVETTTQIKNVVSEGDDRHLKFL